MTWGPVIAVDFETYYTTDYSVASLGTWAYTHDRRFNAYLVAVTDGTRCLVRHPNAFPWAEIAGQTWVSHNRDFDQAVFRRLQELGTIPADVRPAAWYCTAALAAYLQFPRDLAGAAQAMIGRTIDKAPRDRACGQQTSLFPDEMEHYSIADARACWDIWDHYAARWPSHERSLHDLTSQMGERGVAVDWDYVASKRQHLADMGDALRASIPWQPAGSAEGLARACDRLGITPPPSTCADDLRCQRWIEANIKSDAALWVRAVQRIRSIQRTLKVLEGMEARRKPDGRMAYDLKYFGATTGRWSGGGGLNLQNLNRESAEGVDLRRAIVAPPGHRLAIVDYAQIESRVLLWLAGDHATSDRLRQDRGLDLYEAHARATMGYAEPEPLRDYCRRSGSSLRHLAKARVLGLGFGCGWEKFILVARILAGLDIDADESRRIVDDFRTSNPRIVGLWRRLEAQFFAAGETYVLPLPCQRLPRADYERALYYRGRQGDTALVGRKYVNLYGGKLAENWTQATARDVLASAWLRCVRAGYTPVMSTHDELVFEVPGNTAIQDIDRIVRIMETSPPWAADLPLVCDARLADNYSKG